MCNRGQLGLINFLLYTFIVSALLAWGKWNRGDGIKGIARFCWTVKRQTKPAVWQRPGSGSPHARQCWGSVTSSWRRFLRMQWQELLPCVTLQGFLFVCGEQTEVRQQVQMIFSICFNFKCCRVGCQSKKCAVFVETRIMSWDPN